MCTCVSGTAFREGGYDGESSAGYFGIFYPCKPYLGVFCAPGVAVVYGICRAESFSVCLHELVLDDEYIKKIRHKIGR